MGDTKTWLDEPLLTELTGEDSFCLKADLDFDESVGSQDLLASDARVYTTCETFVSVPAECAAEDLERIEWEFD